MVEFSWQSIEEMSPLSVQRVAELSQRIVLKRKCSKSFSELISVFGMATVLKRTSAALRLQKRKLLKYQTELTPADL